MKVDLDNVEDKYKFMCKEEMTKQEIQQLGVIILKDKVANIKHKIKDIKHKIKGLFSREKK
jgi:Txe/YoeB family toxin of Txe-Axe toxin-antitoxin module